MIYEITEVCPVFLEAEVGEMSGGDGVLLAGVVHVSMELFEDKSSLIDNAFFLWFSSFPFFSLFGIA